MPPDKRSGPEVTNPRAAQEESAANASTTNSHIIGWGTDIRNRGLSERRWVGCPCGCSTRLPWLDDPECARHRPIPRTEDKYDDTGVFVWSIDKGLRCITLREARRWVA